MTIKVGDEVWGDDHLWVVKEISQPTYGSKSLVTLIRGEQTFVTKLFLTEDIIPTKGPLRNSAEWKVRSE